MAFRNIYYNNKLGCITLWTWDDTGKRIQINTSFEPYLFIETDAETGYKSIFGSNLKKISFKNNFERNKFLQESNIKKIYQNLPPEQQFLLDTFKDGISTENPIRIFYLDIETYATGGNFSSAEDATDPVNLITIYDTLTKMFYTWGLKKKYESTLDNVVYIKCKDEEELFEKFLFFWKNNYPDYISGWNIIGYDIPFIINRIKRLFDDEKVLELSPEKRIWLRPNASVNLKGQKMDRWTIYGLSILDYMDVYQTFSLGDRESYSLNYISEYELGESKVAYNQVSLTDLADQDWNKFVDYNIQDVRLLILLEEKLKYLKLVQNLSYKGFVSPEKALGKVSLITGAVAHQAQKESLLIPTFNEEPSIRRFEGGFVKEPVPGLYENIVTYDANSLYPNTIITLNISPETKIGRIVEKLEDSVKLRIQNGKVLTIKNDKFSKFLSSEKIAISKSGVLYSQKFKGIIPKFVDALYQQRVDAKNLGKKYEKEKLKETNSSKLEELEQKISDCETLSNVYKVVLNSTYGVFAQQYSPLFDIDHAESITLTGQETVKQGGVIMHQKYINDTGDSVELDEIVKYSDTDSCFIDFSKIFKSRSISKLLNSDGKISDECYKIIEEYGEYLNNEIQKWASLTLGSLDPRYFFKREKICDVALLHKKKNYILHVKDNEGIPTDKFIYKGIEVAKSTMSKEVKNLIKDNIEKSILSRDKKTCKKLFIQTYDKFCSLSEDIISIRKKVNDYDKGFRGYKPTGFAKGTPSHVKAAINYNVLLQKLKIDNKYTKIGNGNKIKIFYLERNKFGFDNIGYCEKYPEEFKEFLKPNYKKQFEKSVSSVISRIYTIIGWSVPIIGKEETVDLLDFFGLDD